MSKSDSSSQQKVIPIVAQDKAETVSLYEAHQKIYPRSVSGYFVNWRWAMVWLTQLFFYCLPWLEWGGRQAVLFDLGLRRFYIFGLVLYPQDFIYLTGLLIISALSLFLFTAVAGRLWCGYACPQTVYTEIFLWIENKVEGDRAARLRLDKSAFSSNKLAKKSIKHLIWILFALWTGFTFVGYFTPIHLLANEFMQWNLGSWEIFWVFFYAFATYGNAGFMREQVCKHMCPYARFQSAMFDKDTLIVTYDEKRGEPRGPRGKNAASTQLGSCVDCGLCVQVCPTGIDIRKGLQYECIGCGACADVCDTVMDKFGFEKGLVKYSTQNAIKNRWDKSTMIARVFRPRVLIYTAILALITLAMLLSLATKPSFKVDVVRDRGVLARIVQGGNIENVYSLQVMNATEKTQTFEFSVAGLPQVKIEGDHQLTVNPAEARWMAVRVRTPYDAASPGSHPIEFKILNANNNELLTEKSVFIIPR